MILSPEEFIKLRKSSDAEKYDLAAKEEAPLEVWKELIKKHPEMKKWVIHNKTIPLEILDLLSKDKNPEIRADVARKRKILETPIFERLTQDEDEGVRFALLSNTKLTLESLKMINSSSSDWFKEAYKKRENELMKNLSKVKLEN